MAMCPKRRFARVKALLAGGVVGIGTVYDDEIIEHHAGINTSRTCDVHLTNDMVAYGANMLHVTEITEVEYLAALRRPEMEAVR